MVRSIVATIGAGGGLSLARTVSDSAGSTDSIANLAVTHGVQINATNTGPAAGGYTSLSSYSGDYTLTGTTPLVGMDISGDLVMNNPNASAVGCRVRGGVRTSNGSRGWTLDWCEVGPSPITTGGVANYLGMAVTPDYKRVYRTNIHNGPDITWISADAGYTAQLIESYCHDSFQPDNDDPHADACQLAGPGANYNTQIIRSKLDMSVMRWWTAGAGSAIYYGCGNSAVQSGDNWTDGTLTLQDSYFAGGNYTLQLLDAQPANRNFYVVTGNYLARGHTPTYSGGSVGSFAYPQFGDVSTNNSVTARITWANNYQYDADAGAVGSLITI